LLSFSYFDLLEYQSRNGIASDGKVMTANAPQSSWQMKTEFDHCWCLRIDECNSLTYHLVNKHLAVHKEYPEMKNKYSFDVTNHGYNSKRKAEDIKENERNDSRNFLFRCSSCSGMSEEHLMGLSMSVCPAFFLLQ
jgi:hypothetical protein